MIVGELRWSALFIEDEWRAARLGNTRPLYVAPVPQVTILRVLGISIEDRRRIAAVLNQ